LSPAGEPFGFERFEAILARESSSPPEKLRDEILAAIDGYTGNAPPDDDRTLVIVTLD
jgi:serine phosphatase RsbU (regulator of sigma subunit)